MLPKFMPMDFLRILFSLLILDTVFLIKSLGFGKQVVDWLFMDHFHIFQDVKDKLLILIL